jgi:hypothetical protein
MSSPLSGPARDAWRRRRHGSIQASPGYYSVSFWPPARLPSPPPADTRGTSTRSGWRHRDHATESAYRIGDRGGLLADRPPPPPRARYRGAHGRLRPVQSVLELLVRNFPNGTPRRDPRLPEGLGEPHVSDARDEALVDQRLADEPRRIGGGAHPRNEVSHLRRLGQQIRPQPTYGACLQSQDGTVPLRGFPFRSAQDEPRQAEPADATLRDPPAPRILRWLRRTTPPSTCSRRCLPIASTRSRIRPSSTRATPVACPRGCGLSAVRRCPTSG